MKLKKIVTALVMALFIPVALMAQEGKDRSLDDDGIPISRSALTAYAVSLARQVEFSVYADAQLGNEISRWTVGYTPSEDGVTAAGIAEFLDDQEFDLTTHRDDSYADVFVEIQDMKGFTLFYAWSDIGLDKENQELDLEFQIGWQIPIYVENIENVEDVFIRTRSEWGNVNETINLQVRNGAILFQSYYAGRPGELVVVMNNGDEIAFNLENGIAFDPSNHEVEIGGMSIEGVKHMTANQLSNVMIPSNNGIVQPCMIEVKSHEKGFQSVVGYSSEGYLPIAVCVRKTDADTDEFEYIEYTVDDDEPTQVELEQGTYHIWFLWDIPEARAHRPYHGGKG